MAEKKYKYNVNDRDYFFSKFKDFLNEDIDQELEEHQLTPENKASIIQFGRYIQSFIQVTKRNIDNYEKTDNVEQLQKAYRALDDLIDEAGSFQRQIKDMIDDHNMNKK